jgi:hypothetical protein
MNMNTIINGKRFRALALLAGWLLALLAAPATVMGGCLITPNANYTLLVEATSSCSGLSANMHGCTTNASGTCVIPNPTSGGVPIVVQMIPSNAVGSTPTATGFGWTATGPAALGTKLVDVAIMSGATAGSTCSWSYTPGVGDDTGLAFLKTNGTYAKVNNIYFCSDFTAPPPALAKIVLSKTVMLKGGNCGADDVDVLELNAGAEVEYCFTVENVGAGGSSDVTLSDPGAFAADQLLGNIDAGAPKTTLKSPSVVITETGEIINTATVTWVNNEDPALSTGSASDTAKVVSTLSLEACPDEYQQLVDGTIQGSEDFFGLAALYDPNAPERVAICTPGGSAGTECVDECIVKDVCKVNPLDPQCVEPNYQCEPSGAWTVGDVNSCTDQSGSGGTPYCWELQADPDKDCYYEPVQPMKTHTLLIEEIHVNPYCYYVTSKIGTKTTTVQHCF